MKKPKNLIPVMLVFLGWFAGSEARATVRYVKTNGPASATGTDWVNATNDLQAMITQSTAGDTIWVAQGTYLTLTTGQPFRMKSGVKIYGGFAEGATEFSSRNWTTRLTILQGNGSRVIGNNSVNSAAVLDGFTIQGGTAPSNTPGAGMWNSASSPSISHCVFRNNIASGGTAAQGGGMANTGTSRPTITDCAFYSNAAQGGGGGMHNDNSQPVIKNCIFSGNSVTGITTSSSGGAILNIGALIAPLIANCIFTGNIARYGSAIYNNGAITRMQIINCSFSGNRTTVNPGTKAAIETSNTPLSIINCIVWGNSDGIKVTGAAPRISYSLVQGMTGTTNGNLNGNSTNPLFINAVTFMNAPTIDGDYRLQSGSPVINKGSNDSIPADITTDITGAIRIQNDIVEMGAYEKDLCPAGNMLYVDSSLAVGGDGTSWATALQSLAKALDIARQCTNIDSILVARGTYYPEYRLPGGTRNRDKTFYINRGKLVVLGGYAPGGVTRNHNVYLTILSGDLDKNQTLDTFNAFHVVVTAAGVTNTFLLDGFTISGGNTDGNGNSTVNGIYRNDGAGWHNSGYPRVSHITISGNSAKGYGGGWYNWSGNPSVNHIIINGNSADRGGGWYNYSGDPSVANSLIYGNSTTEYGGGWFNESGNPTVINSTICSNSANSVCGGWLNFGGSSLISNSIIYGNIGADGDIYGSPNITYSLIGENFPGSGNIYSDPRFVAPHPAANAPTTAGDYHLKPCSPAINKGYNNSIPAGITTDLEGNARIWDQVNGGIVDVGAYEYQGKPGVDTGHLAVFVCKGQAYSFAGNSYDTTVLVTHNIFGTFQTASGCDSMVQFTLTLKDTFVTKVSDTVCEGDLPYIWGSQYIETTGIYTEIFHSASSCDSTVTLNLQVNDTFITEQSLSLNYSQLPYTFGQQTLTQTGTYTESFPTINNCDSTVILHLSILYAITGKVHNDVNGMNNGNAINGNGTNAGGLKAVLVDKNADTLTAYTVVDVNGNFVFDHLPVNNYTLLITKSSIAGNTVPAISLPSGWQHTGEKTGTGNGNDGLPDGRLELDSISQNLAVRFGIQQPPVVSNSSVASQLNPGSNASVNLPNSKFIMSDPSPGAVTKVRFTAFPTGTDIFYINGNSYTSSNWPGTVVVNAQYLFGNLLMPNVSIDPTTGPQQVLISYQAMDAAGAASNTATITMPFFGIEIGGMVHNNFQGMNGSPVNTITGPGTNGGGLYALLSNDISNKVVATQAVNGSTGAYQFTGIDKGYYTVRLSTTDALPGATPPASGINPGWKATAEKNGTGAGNDGFADSKIYLDLQSANNNNVRFGIQQPPTASPDTAASQLNPNGNINYTVPAATFVTMDAAPGAVTSLYFSGALPTNANKLVLSGTTYSATNPLPPAGVHVAVSGGSPLSPILVDPVNGNVTVTISYNAVDAAGMMSAIAAASQPFHNTAPAMAGNTHGNGAAPASPEEQGLATFKALDISIYPNPAKDKVFIKANDFSLVKTLRLLDIQGRELRITRQDITNGMDMGGLASGTYLLQVELQNGSSQRFKVIKE